MNATDEGLIAALRAAFGRRQPTRIGVAVSGGGDSVALLHLLTRCFQGDDVTLFAATVDHGLRAQAGDEARAVGALCERLGVAHETLRWSGWDGQGNLQDQARRARYALLADWARARDIGTILTGHSADDQAETVLMRLARTSGVDGLSAMPLRRVMHGVVLMRPLLGVGRAELRTYLRRNDLTWAEDPGNEDLAYDRIRARAALNLLKPLGIDARTLGAVADNMARARDALDWHSVLAARTLVRVDAGDVLLDLALWRNQPDEIARRLLSRAITWVGTVSYPPRRAPLGDLIRALQSGRGGTLGGCRILVTAAGARICREWGAVRDLRVPAGEVWDARWRLHGPVADDLELRALGQGGLSRCPEWRETGRPHGALCASPAVWRGDDLVAAPLAGFANGWHAERIGGGEDFLASLLSH